MAEESTNTGISHSAGICPLVTNSTAAISAASDAASITSVMRRLSSERRSA